MSSVIDFIRKAAVSIFAIDLRALALFRISFGIAVLAEIIIRLQVMTALFSDAGALPRHTLLQYFVNSYRWSVFNISGSTIFTSLIFAIALISCFTFIIGYKSRISTVLLWIIVVSLHNRNPIVNSGADDLLRLMLFWSMFLPLGARYSVDVALVKTPLKRLEYTSPASAMILFQLAFMYYFSGILKSDPIWWNDFTAIEYALNIETFTSSFGVWALSWPKEILRSTTAVIWYAEQILPLAIFIPFYANIMIRPFVILFFWAFHFGLFLCLYLGVFPYVCMACWTLFIPKWVFDYFDNKWIHSKNVQIYYDGNCRFCRVGVYVLTTFLFLRNAEILKAQQHPSMEAKMLKHNSWIVVLNRKQYFTYPAFVALVKASPFRRLSFLIDNSLDRFIGGKLYWLISNNRQLISKFVRGDYGGKFTFRTNKLMHAFVIFAGIYAFLWNLGNYNKNWVSFSYNQRIFSHLTRVGQRWNLFAPKPATHDGWFIIEGKLRNGTTVDIYQNGADLSYQKPKLVSRTYDGPKWRKYWPRLAKKRYKKARRPMGQYLCRQWNSKHKKERALESIRVIYMLEKTDHNITSLPASATPIWSQNCFPKKQKKPVKSKA